MITNQSAENINLKTQPTIGIIQMSSAHDVVLTLKSLEKFKTLHPHIRLVLIAKQSSTVGLDFIINKYVDATYHIDLKKLSGEVTGHGLTNGLYQLNDTLNSINKEQIDVLINLSYSKTSSYLCTVIDSIQKVGNYFNSANELISEDKWTNVIRSSVLRGSLNPFHLCELFSNVIGIKKNTQSSTIGISKTISAKDDRIVIHPFGTHERNSWKVEKWVEVIYKTLKDNSSAVVTLIGEKKDLIKSQLVLENALLKQFATRISNNVGKLSLEEASKLIEKSKVFISHESIYAQLASFGSTPTVTIALGITRAHETTPFHANAYLITPKTKCYPCNKDQLCSFLQCHHDIPYQLVSNIVSKLFSNSSVDTSWTIEHNSSFHLSSVSISKFSERSYSLATEVLNPEAVSTSEAMRTFYKMTWSFLLNDQDENEKYPKLTNQAYSDLIDVANALQYFFELSEFGMKYSRFILEEIGKNTPDINAVKEFSKKIDEIDHLQKMLIKTAAPLSPLIEYHMLRKGNMHGDNIVQIAESSYMIFDEASQLSSVLYELIQNTIVEHRTIHNLPTPHENEIK